MRGSWILGGAALILLLAAPAARAQASVKIRGTIERIDGAAYVVKDCSGGEVKVTLTDRPVIHAIAKASLADIKQGSFVGAAAMPHPDGAQKALEVHVFPESMRGTGEGYRPFDLRPNSTMTNANAGQVVSNVDGQTLTLKYKGGERKLIVSPATPVVTFEPGNKDALKAGTNIIVIGTKQPDGSIKTARLNYGKDGITPPM